MTEPFRRNDSLLGTGNYRLTEKELEFSRELSTAHFHNSASHSSGTKQQTTQSLPTGVTNERNDSSTDNINWCYMWYQQPNYNEIASLAVCSVPAVYYVSQAFCMKLYFPNNIFSSLLVYII
jgi:hypothetical protein